MRLGWEQADGAPFRRHFEDWAGARYIESGGQNVGLDDLIEHHVEAEGKALALDLKFENPDVHIDGDVAWALVDTVVRATILKTGVQIHSKGFETIILRRVGDQWKVIHTHSSSRPVK